MRAHLPILAIACFAAAACGNSVSPDDGSAGRDGEVTSDSLVAVDAATDESADAAAPDTNSDDATAADVPAGACNAIANTAMPATSTQRPGVMPPVMTGGNIVPGSYHLTERVYFRAASVVVEQMTLVVAGSVANYVSRRAGSAETRGTATYAAVGNRLLNAVTCPSGVSPANATFTATDTQLQVFNQDQLELVTYSRR